MCQQFRENRGVAMKKKIIWWIQLVINCLFFLYLAQKIDTMYHSGPGLSFVISIFLIIIAIVLGYALTVGFENDEH